MSMFLYKLKDETGRVFWGVVEARDKKEVKRKFRSTEYFLIGVESYSKKKLSQMRLPLDALVIFTHRFYSLIEAGLPILSALNILWRQSESHDVQIITSHIRKCLEDGSNLGEAINEFPLVFPVMYRALISVAEEGAGLVPILAKISEYLEDQKAFIARAKKAVLYPSLVLVFAVLVLLGMFLFVVPTFQKVLEKLHVKLPFFTQLIFHISEVLRSGYFYLFLGLVVGGGIVVYKKFRTNRHFRLWMDDFKLRVPYFRNIFYMLSMSRFVRSLSLLIGAGISIIVSLDTAKTTVVNQKIEQAVDEIRKQVIEGISLYPAFKSTKMFPLMLVEMIGIGETSGSLAKLLTKSAVHFDEEVDYYINKFLTYLEPLLIILVGGIVGIILLGIYLPIFSLWVGLSNL